MTSWCSCHLLRNTGPISEQYSSDSTSSRSMRNVSSPKPLSTFWIIGFHPRTSPCIQKRSKPCSLTNSMTSKGCPESIGVCTLLLDIHNPVCHEDRFLDTIAIERGELHTGSNEQYAFEWLKEAFSTDPILCHSNLLRPFMVEMDVSMLQWGCCCCKLP